MTPRHPDDAELVREWLHEPVRLTPIDTDLVVGQIEDVPQRSGLLPWPGTWRTPSLSSATRFVVAGAFVALVGGVVLSNGLVEPDASDGRPGTAAASPLASDPISTDEPTNDIVAADDAKYPQTSTITEFTQGEDPIDLELGPDGRAYFIDQAAGTLVRVDDDGYQTRVLGVQDPDGVTARFLAGARLLTRAGDDVMVVDADGSIRGVGALPSGFNVVSYDFRPDIESIDGTPPFDTGVRAIAGLSRGPEDFDLFAIDPESTHVFKAELDQYHNFQPADSVAELDAEERGEARGLLADPELYVLYETEIVRYVRGRLDEDFALDLPPGEVDLRALSGTGPAERGHLYVFDAAGERILVFRKTDGTLVDAWTAGPDDPPMTDIRGMAAREWDDGRPTVVTWTDPSGVFESLLTTEPVADIDTGVTRYPDSPQGGTEQAIDWQTPSIGFEADRLRIDGNGTTFSGASKPDLDGDVGVRERQLDAVWHEKGIEQRLKLILTADESQWWISEIWTYDGVKKDGSWVFYQNLDHLTRTPRGETLVADIDLRPTDVGTTRTNRDRLLRDARLRIEGMRLTGFAPGTGPEPPTDCELLDTEADPRLDLLSTMTPQAAEERLQELDLCHEFYYVYGFAEPGKAGTTRYETWCTAPPVGSISKVEQHAGSRVRVWVRDPEPRIPREDPPVEWRCRAIGDASPARQLTVPELAPPGSLLDGELVHTFETHFMLPGQRQRVTAEYCVEDACVPAEDVRWKNETPSRARITKRQGPVTTVIAGDEPGEVELEVVSPKSGVSFGPTIMPPPGTDARPAIQRPTWPFPVEQELRVGQYFLISGWQCPKTKGDRNGPDGTPGTADDDCTQSAVTRSDPFEGSGLSLVDNLGSVALMHVDDFARVDDGDLIFAGVRLNFGDEDIQFPDLYVRDEEWHGPLLGDVDGNGSVDEADRDRMAGALEGLSVGAAITPADGDAWSKRLDVDGDQRIDSVDLALVAALIEARAG